MYNWFFPPEPAEPPGQPGNCSQSQLQTLKNFQQFVSDLNGGHLHPSWDDHYLLRFLRARKFVLSDCQEMWKKFIVWRLVNDMDNIWTWRMDEIIVLRDVYPHGFHWSDRKGRPIYIQRVGFLDTELIFHIATQQKILKYYSLIFQTLVQKIFKKCSESSGTPVTQLLVILDLANLSLSSSSQVYSFLKPILSILQDNYPELLYKMYIINSPFLFTTVWSVISYWIDQKTVEKIRILGDKKEYREELLREVDGASLPQFIDGGRCGCLRAVEAKDANKRKGKEGDECLRRNFGVWNPQGSEIFQGNVGKKGKSSEKQQQEGKIQQKIKQIKIAEKENRDKLQKSKEYDIKEEQKK